MKSFMLAALVTFPLASAAEIQIVSATYGLNCGASRDNAKPVVEQACNGRKFCTYAVDYHVLGDGANC